MGTEPYPSIFPLHFGGFVLNHTRIWWASGLHGKLPLKPSLLAVNASPLRLLPSLLHRTFVCEAADRRLPMGPSRSERGRGVLMYKDGN